MTYSDIPQRNDTPKSLFNPLKNDFIAQIRDDKNVQQTYIVHSLEIETFPTWLAEVLEKKLVNEIKISRGASLFSKEEEDKIKKEVEVVI